MFTVEDKSSVIMAVCSTRYPANVITLHSEVTLTITFRYCMLRAKGHGLAGYRNVQNTSPQRPGANFTQPKDEHTVPFSSTERKEIHQH